MTQLKELTAFIEQHLPPRARSTFTSEMENITVLQAPKNQGNGCLRTAIRRYDALLSWESWPYRQADPDVLFALINSWLTNQANSLRDELALGDYSVDVEVNDEGSAAIDITVTLADAQILVEDPEGGIPWGVRRYRLGAPDIWLAENARVHFGDSE